MARTQCATDEHGKEREGGEIPALIKKRVTDIDIYAITKCTAQKYTLCLILFWPLIENAFPKWQLFFSFHCQNILEVVLRFANTLQKPLKNISLTVPSLNLLLLL